MQAEIVNDVQLGLRQKETQGFTAHGEIQSLARDLAARLGACPGSNMSIRLAKALVLDILELVDAA